jgi:hypothetical protein
VGEGAIAIQHRNSGFAPGSRHGTPKALPARDGTRDHQQSCLDKAATDRYLEAKSSEFRLAG